MYVHLNEHAVMAWMYVYEAVVLYKGKVKGLADYEFVRLMLNLEEAYPDELDYVMRNFRVRKD